MVRQSSPTQHSNTSRTVHASRKSKKRGKTAAHSPAVTLADLRKLKVAIVCDWLTGTGGAERVVLEIHKLFPDAPIYTSQYDRNPKIWYGDRWFQDADVRTTRLQYIPKRLKKFLPVLRARAFSRLDLSAYDLVIISSSAEAKAVKTSPDAKVIWYCHAPTHYYWSRYDEYMKHPGMGALDPLARVGLFSLVRPLRRWDKIIAQKPGLVVANSTHIQSEIKKYYDRSSIVVYPPVDTVRFAQFANDKIKGDRFGFVIAGRQTPYKRIDLAVEACSRLRLPLTVIGSGPDHDKLIAMAGSSVRFLNRVSDAEMAHHFHLAQAFIFPGIDDFGITPVEAMSAGTPVIAYKGGGALDYIKPGVTGEFFTEQTAESLMDALRSFKADTYDSSAITTYAQTYAIDAFGKQLTDKIAGYVATTSKSEQA